MRSPSCSVPSLAARPVSVMCLIKIWLPSFSPYSVQKQSFLDRNNLHCSSFAADFCTSGFVFLQTKRFLSPSRSWSLTICGFLFYQSCFEGFFRNIIVRQPLVPRRHQRQRVSMPVAFRRGATTAVTVIGTVAAGVDVVAAIRVASRSSRRLLIQQVGLWGRPSWSGRCGHWDLDLTRTFHCLGKTQKTAGQKEIQDCKPLSLL